MNKKILIVIVFISLFISSQIAKPIFAIDTSKETVTCRNLLKNGDFSTPQLKENVQFVKNIPGWKTTASNGIFELWKSGTENIFNSHSNQFLELNSNEASSIYQDFRTLPGEKLKWKLYHRGRIGDDTAQVSIGNPQNNLLEVKTITTGKEGWKLYKGDYTVPKGQTVTRIIIKSIKYSGNDKTIGNLISNISVTVADNKPIINGTENKIIKINDSFNPLVGVTATDDLDGNITKNIKVLGTVDTKKPGKYNITYTVTDTVGNTTTEIRTITVADNKPIINGTENKIIKINDSFNPLVGVTATDDLDGNISNVPIAITLENNLNTKLPKTGYENIFGLLSIIIIGIGIYFLTKK
ncbi:MAG: immunoglobulin-like domain-containing protein [Clostridium sp.]